MRILFISRYFSEDPRTMVQGVYKRMGIFIEAIREIAPMDMLFYTPKDTYYSPDQTSRMERLYSEHWKTEIKLFLTPVSEYKNRTRSEKLTSFGKAIFSIFNQHGYLELSGDEQVRALEECLGRNPDAIFAHRLPSMCPLLLTKKLLPPIFFDFDDIEHIVQFRLIEQYKKLRSKLLYLLLPALRSGELKALRLATETYVCSEKDRAYIENEFNQPHVFTIPNAVSIPELQSQTDEKTILFIGSDYMINLDTADYLVSKIWPHIYREVPDARLILAGISADKLKRGISDAPGIEITGFVDDLDELYRRSRVIATPILVGGGTRIKIIEAAAYGKPVVSTTIGMEGIDLSEGTEILIHDNPKEFAEACVRLLRDPGLCREIGTAARAKATLLYDRKAVLRSVRDHIMHNMKISAS